MRLRTMLTSCATALLLAGLSPAVAAEAGTGGSMACSDGVTQPGGQEYVIDDTVITLAAETAPNSLTVCYSTAGSGVPGQVTGGIVRVAYVTSGPAPYQTFTQVRCATDYQFGVAPQCDAYGLVVAEDDDVQVTPYPNAVCAVWLNGSCTVYVPGIKVVTDATPSPLLTIDTFGQNVQVGIPAQCVSLFVPCP
jgi:hypothetical protein